MVLVVVGGGGGGGGVALFGTVMVSQVRCEYIEHFESCLGMQPNPCHNSREPPEVYCGLAGFGLST